MSFTSFGNQPLFTREEMARKVRGVSLSPGLDELATVMALMTIGTEAGSKGQWWCPSNTKDPSSRKNPHDSASNDGRSVGYFQQHNGGAGGTVTGSDNWWGSMQSRMTVDQAALGLIGGRGLRRGQRAFRRVNNIPTLISLTEE